MRDGDDKKDIAVSSQRTNKTRENRKIAAVGFERLTAGRVS